MENWKKFINEEFTFRNPNIEFEWDEARVWHKEEFPTKEIWFKLASQGREVDASQLAGKIDNTSFSSDCKAMEKEYQHITPDRQERIDTMFSGGEIELPIVRKLNGEYKLIAGNTRLTMMGRENCNSGTPIRVWLIDLDKIK
jgi:hypothetical protein